MSFYCRVISLGSFEIQSIIFRLKGEMQEIFHHYTVTDILSFINNMPVFAMMQISVAEPEPPGAATFRVEPGPIFFC